MTDFRDLIISGLVIALIAMTLMWNNVARQLSNEREACAQISSAYINLLKDLGGKDEETIVPETFWRNDDFETRE